MEKTAEIKNKTSRKAGKADKFGMPSRRVRMLKISMFCCSMRKPSHVYYVYGLQQWIWNIFPFIWDLAWFNVHAPSPKHKPWPLNSWDVHIYQSQPHLPSVETFIYFKWLQLLTSNAPRMTCRTAETVSTQKNAFLQWKTWKLWENSGFAVHMFPFKHHQ